jgi:CheY-like chemotaxis protein
VIEGRIKALSRVHAILSDTRWEGAELTRLVNEELAPYRSARADRIRVVGPDVVLNATTAQTLALALHELATNAAKYGALSQTSGTLELRWRVEPTAIVIDWQEAGGPPTRAPVKTGFGSRIITNSIERQLDGKTSFDWRPEGLSCSLIVPHRPGFDTRRDVRADSTKDPSTHTMPCKRILIVEDEALVAMILEDQLQELGLAIVGCCATVAEAIKLLDADTPDAAILDVNLGGQFVYPVADRLIDRGIPFVFVTGYGRESVDQRYSAIRVLEKPVERKALEGLFARMPDRSYEISPAAHAQAG